VRQMDTDSLVTSFAAGSLACGMFVALEWHVFALITALVTTAAVIFAMFPSASSSSVFDTAPMPDEIGSNGSWEDTKAQRVAIIKRGTSARGPCLELLALSRWNVEGAGNVCPDSLRGVRCEGLPEPPETLPSASRITVASHREVADRTITVLIWNTKSSEKAAISGLRCFGPDIVVAAEPGTTLPLALSQLPHASATTVPEILRVARDLLDGPLPPSRVLFWDTSNHWVPTQPIEWSGSSVVVRAVQGLAPFQVSTTIVGLSWENLVEAIATRANTWEGVIEWLVKSGSSLSVAHPRQSSLDWPFLMEGDRKSLRGINAFLGDTSGDVLKGFARRTDPQIA
jgi:hypothetical protein